MGGRASVQSIIAEQAQKTREEVIRSVLPIYYTTDELTTKEKSLLYESFHFIMKGKAENFRESYHDDKKCPAYHFGTLFFGRLFETNTAVKGLFVRDMHKMSHSLIDIFTLLIDDLAGPVERVIEDEKDNVEDLENTKKTNNNRWKKTLEILVKSHNAKGIRAIECKFFIIIHSPVSSRMKLFLLIIRWCIWRNFLLDNKNSMWRGSLYSCHS